MRELTPSFRVKQNPGQPVAIDTIGGIISDVTVQADATAFPDGIATEPSSDVRVISSKNSKIQLARRVVIQASETKICVEITLLLPTSPKGIVVVPRPNGSGSVHQLADVSQS